jgi:hypothetical protein
MLRILKKRRKNHLRSGLPWFPIGRQNTTARIHLPTWTPILGRYHVRLFTARALHPTAAKNDFAIHDFANSFF